MLMPGASKENILPSELFGSPQSSQSRHHSNYRETLSQNISPPNLIAPLEGRNVRGMMSLFKLEQRSPAPEVKIWRPNV